MVISYEIYKTSLVMTTRVRSCLSYDLSNAILLPSKLVYFKENVYCFHRLHHDVTCSHESVNTCLVINIIFDMTLSTE